MLNLCQHAWLDPLMEQYTGCMTSCYYPSPLQRLSIKHLDFFAHEVYWERMGQTRVLPPIKLHVIESLCAEECVTITDVLFS